LQAAATSRAKVSGLWRQAASSRNLGTIPRVPVADSRILPHLQPDHVVMWISLNLILHVTLGHL
jgi:hypothetical protein